VSLQEGKGVEIKMQTPTVQFAAKSIMDNCFGLNQLIPSDKFIAQVAVADDIVEAVVDDKSPFHSLTLSFTFTTDSHREKLSVDGGRPRGQGAGVRVWAVGSILRSLWLSSPG